MKFLSLLNGIKSYFPGVNYFFSKGKGGINSARYCYFVWLKHLIMADKYCLSTRPKVIVEIGPGDSLGTGLAALLSGVNKYYALDIVEYANKENNINVFEGLTELFKKREKFPNENYYLGTKSFFESNRFPDSILTDELLNESLKKERIDSLKNEILNLENENNDNTHIFYLTSGSNKKIIRNGTVDMLFSHSVMEYVDDLQSTYNMFFHWLTPGGFMSHHIDFTCHNTAKLWNGHWAYSDFIWRFMKGKYPSFITRQPHSVHVEIMKRNGFEIVCDEKYKDASGIQGKNLSLRFKNLSDEDLMTRAALIQSVKKSNFYLTTKD